MFPHGRDNPDIGCLRFRCCTRLSLSLSLSVSVVGTEVGGGAPPACLRETRCSSRLRSGFPWAVWHRRLDPRRLSQPPIGWRALGTTGPRMRWWIAFVPDDRRASTVRSFVRSFVRGWMAYRIGSDRISPSRSHTHTRGRKTVRGSPWRFVLFGVGFFLRDGLDRRQRTGCWCAGLPVCLSVCQPIGFPIPGRPPPGWSARSSRTTGSSHPRGWPAATWPG